MEQFQNGVSGFKRFCEIMDEEPETDEGYVTLVHAKKDENGEFVKNTFTQNGVSVDFVKSSSDKTSFTEVMSVTGGERTFFTYPGTGADFGYDDIDYDKLQAKIFHLGYFLLLQKVDDGDGLGIGK